MSPRHASLGHVVCPRCRCLHSPPPPFTPAKPARPWERLAIVLVLVTALVWLPAALVALGLLVSR